MDGGLQVYQSLALCVIKNQLFFTGGSYGYDESSEDFYYIHASTEHVEQQPVAGRCEAASHDE